MCFLFYHKGLVGALSNHPCIYLASVMINVNILVASTKTLVLVTHKISAIDHLT